MPKKVVYSENTDWSSYSRRGLYAIRQNQKKRGITFSSLEQELKKRKSSKLGKTKYSESTDWSSYSRQVLYIIKSRLKSRNITIDSLDKELERRKNPTPKRKGPKIGTTKTKYSEETDWSSYSRSRLYAINQNQKKRGITFNSLEQELEKRKSPTPKRRGPKPGTTKYSEDTDWGKYATATLQNTRRRLKKKGTAFDSLEQELKKRQPQVDKLCSTNHAKPSDNQLRAKKSGHDRFGVHYDFTFNGRTLIKDRPMIQLYTAFDERVLVFTSKGFNNGSLIWNVFLPNGIEWHPKSISPFSGQTRAIANVSAYGDKLRIDTVGGRPEYITGTEVADEKYDLSALPAGIYQGVVNNSSESTGSIQTADTPPTISDTDYSVCMRPSDEGMQNVYINGTKVLHNVPSVQFKTFMKDRVLGVLTDQPEKWYLFFYGTYRYDLGTQRPANVVIRDILERGAWLKLMLSDGNVANFNCTDLLTKLKKYQIER